MDFGKLIGRALKIAWNHKILWVLGFFASFLGGSEIFVSEDHKARAGEFISQHPVLLTIVLSYAFFLFVFFLCMHIVGSAGLIKAVSQIEENRPGRLREYCGSGLKYFARFLGLWFILTIAVIIAALAVVMPIVAGFFFSTLIGVLLLAGLIPVGLIALFIIFTIYHLAQRDIAIGDRSLFDGLGTAYNLLRNHIGKSVVVFLVNMIAGLILFSFNTFLILLLAIPLILGGFESIKAIILLLIMEVPLFIAIAIPLTGFFGTFMNALYTIFYMELQKTPTPPKETDLLLEEPLPRE
jgi:hypothetical protein